MIAVTNTSPLCYLVLINEIDVLPKLFSQVLAPAAVVTELLHEDAPLAVREWAANLPLWISVQEVSPGGGGGLEKLHVGERDAILLAESVNADVILLDEKSARRVATERGLPISGTLGVLSEAAVRGHVDLLSAVDRLRRTTFRCPPVMLKAILDRYHGGSA